MKTQVLSLCLHSPSVPDRSLCPEKPDRNDFEERDTYAAQQHPNTAVNARTFHSALIVQTQAFHI